MQVVRLKATSPRESCPSGSSELKMLQDGGNAVDPWQCMHAPPAPKAQPVKR